MIIECPKCGFVQPQDRYCANCGIDMENFHAKPQPLIVRVLNSPSLYISLFIFSLVVLVLFIATQPESKIARTAKSWVLSSGDETQEIQETENAPTEVNDIEDKVESSSIVNSENTISETSESADEKKTETTTSNEVKTPENFHIEFVEFSRAQLDKLYNQSKILAETNDMQVMVFNKNTGLTALKELDGELTVLPGGHEQKISENPTQVFNFVYTNSKGEEQGMSFQSTISSLTANNLSIEYEIFYNVRAGEENEIINNSLSGTYQFSPQSTLILSGILPRQKLNDEASQELGTTPLSIMTSEDFISPDAQSPSEFLILISVK